MTEDELTYCEFRHLVPVGTRVYHKRYKHMVGTVVHEGYQPGEVYVCWESFWNGPSKVEQIHDLRVTPWGHT